MTHAIYFTNKRVIPPYSSLLTVPEEVNFHGVEELICVTHWMQRHSSQQAKLIEKRQREKMLETHVKLIAGCPDSKHFWADNNHELECFARNFSQKRNKSYEHFDKVPWMTKCIKKNDELLTNYLLPLMYVRRTLGHP
jgi:hypothetical protein